MKLVLLLFSFGLVILSGCEEPVFSDCATVACTQIRIDPNEATQPAGLYTVKSAAVYNNNLSLVLSYGGGCHELFAFATSDGSFLESNPVECQLTLILNDDDHCKYIVDAPFCIDLTGLADHYKKIYQTSSGKILLRIPEYDELVEFDF